MSPFLSFRILCLTFLPLLSASSWGKETPKPIWFSAANDNGGASGASSFVFDFNEWKCRVDDKGRGRCSIKGSAWNFKLPTADGVISNLFVQAGRGNFVYSVDNGEVVWATAAQISPRRSIPKWVVQLPGLNFTTPILYGDRIVVASSMSVASISATTGDWIWRHQWIHDGGAGVSPKINMDAATLHFAIIGVDSKEIGPAICFNLDFGSIVACK